MLTAQAALGRRERNKADKLQRIRQATRELFAEKGYGATTIREIAMRADVGFGTLFTYVSDKRDLLFLIFNDGLAETVEEAFTRAQAEADFLDQLLQFFAAFYRFFEPQPALSRYALREMVFYLTGRQASQFQASRDRLLGHLATLAANAQAAGRVTRSEPPDVLARAIFATYAAELRRWLRGDAPEWQSGVAELRRMLRLHMKGLEAREG